MLIFGGDQGFTLVEVMVSLAVFLVAVTALLALLLTQMQTNRNLRMLACARSLAGAAMAELQVVDYSRLEVLSAAPTRQYGIEVRRRFDTSGLPDGQGRITVSAHWQNRGRQQHYLLQTLRAAP